MSTADKIKNREEMQQIAQELRESGKRIVFTNGCFDVLHIGHSRYLEEASHMGDILIIGLNTDSSVQKVKGPKRPIMKEHERAEMLSSLGFVDYVVLFDEFTADALIGEIKPDVYVKGGDYRVEDIPEAKTVKGYGGQVFIIRRVEGFSTSEVINKILENYSDSDDNKVKELERSAERVRDRIIKMTAFSGSGHPGGSLSCADILTALYCSKLNIDKNNPRWENRDRIILSKGHAAPALYAALAEAGIIPEEELSELRKMGSRLQGHPSRKFMPFVDVSTGSLGQGISVAEGIAYAGRLDNRNYKTYVIMGDGELQEGQVWESLIRISHYKLNNLVVIVDRNGLQTEGMTEKIMAIEPLSEKFRSFGFFAIEIDGHSMREIISALEKAGNSENPAVIIANTTKGSGVAFMEGNVKYHGRPPSKEEFMALCDMK